MVNRSHAPLLAIAGIDMSARRVRSERVMIVLLILFVSVCLFALGALVGSSMETYTAAQRGRRLAMMQREINNQARGLEAAGVLDPRRTERYVHYEIGS